MADPQSRRGVPLPPEIMELVLQFASPEDAARFAQVSRASRAVVANLKLQKVLKALQALEKDDSVISEFSEVVNLIFLDYEPPDFLVRNTIAILAWFADTRMLRKKVVELRPKWPVFLEDTFISFNAGDIPIHGIDKNARMLEALIAVSFNKRDKKRIEETLLAQIDDLSTNEDEWGVGPEAQAKLAKKNLYDITLQRFKFSHLTEDKMVPFELDLLKPIIKPLSRLVAFVWQCIPTSQELAAEKAFRAFFAKYNDIKKDVDMLMDSWIDYEESKRRFGDKMSNIMRLQKSHFANTGELGPMVSFANQNPLPDFGLLPATLMAPLTEDQVVDLQTGLLNLYVRQEAVFGRNGRFRLKAGDYVIDHMSLMDKVMTRPFTNLAEFLAHFLYVGDPEDGFRFSPPGLYYTYRSVTWHLWMMRLVADVVPEANVVVPTLHPAPMGVQFKFADQIYALQRQVRSPWTKALVKDRR